MEMTSSITKEDKQEKEEDNLWRLQSIAQILAAIGAGFNTSRLIIKKGKVKRRSQQLTGALESQGMISQGTFNAKRNEMERGGFITPVNRATINKQKKECFNFVVNYDKLFTQLFILIQFEMKQEENQYKKTLLFIEERADKLKKSIDAFQKKMEDIKKQGKQVGIDEEIEIVKLNQWSKELGFTYKQYLLLKDKIDVILNSINTLKANSSTLNDDERNALIGWLKARFYWMTLMEEKNTGLNDLLGELIQKIYAGRLQYLYFEKHGKLQDEEITGLEVEFNGKCHPTLRKFVIYGKRQSELGQIFKIKPIFSYNTAKAGG